MALQSMTALASITLQSASASVIFSGIPQNYRDLILVANYTGSANGGTPTSINGSAANLSRMLMYGVGSDAGSATASDFNFGGIYTSNRTLGVAQFIDYSATDKHKTILLRSGTNPSPNEVVATAIRWASTSAINSISLAASAGTLSIGSTFNLYGRIV
jgi:hypothetical protein